MPYPRGLVVCVRHGIDNHWCVGLKEVRRNAGIVVCHVWLRLVLIIISFV